jgi:hypothetical protein
LLLKVGVCTTVGSLAAFPGRDDDTDFFIANLTVQGKQLDSVPAIPVNTTVNGRPETQIWPLTFSLVSECLAAYAQRSFLASVNKTYFDRFFRSYRVVSCGQPFPYSLIPIALSSCARRHGVKGRPDSNVFWECLARSLFTSEWLEGSYENASAGAIGRDILRDFENHLDVVAGKLSWNPHLLTESPGKHLTIRD